MSEETSIEDWEQQLDTYSLMCRDFRHSWAPRTARRVTGGFERELECERCSTRKVQKLDLDGTITDTRMVYDTEKGYLRPRGAGRVTSSENARLRASLMRRITR